MKSERAQHSEEPIFLIVQLQLACMYAIGAVIGSIVLVRMTVENNVQFLQQLDQILAFHELDYLPAGAALYILDVLSGAAAVVYTGHVADKLDRREKEA